MSTQSQRSFSIRRAGSNDGEAIVACLAAAFAPYSNSYTPAAFTDTVLDPRLVQHRLREMCVFVAVSEGKGGGTAACGGSGGERHFRGGGVPPGWAGKGGGPRLRPGPAAEGPNKGGKRLRPRNTPN